MSFNPLKRIVKSTLNKDPVEEIFWGNPTADTYNKAIMNYRSMPLEYKQETLGRCLKKLAKAKQSDLVIANLALLHKLMKIDWVSLPSKQPLIQDSKKKQSIGQRNFIKFYYTFLKSTQLQIVNTKSTFESILQYGQLALQKCFSIIRNNLVIEYCINHSANQVTLRIALKQIFEDIRADLLFVQQLVEKNASKIYQQNNDNSFTLNQIYEKLIYLGKNMGKISVLIKKACLSINLPVYQLNKDLNMKIQMEMNLRKDQKIKFKTQKSIRSQKNIALQESNHIYDRQNICHSLSQIEEDEILIQHEELL